MGIRWGILLAFVCTLNYGLAQNRVQVIIRVNAKGLKDTKNFGIRGNLNPLSWDKTTVLEDADKDGIFYGEIMIENARLIEYKFVYGDKKIVYELDGQPNRVLVLDKNKIELNLQWDVPSKVIIDDLPKLTPEQLLQDFNVLKSALQTIHPGLNRYQTPASMDSVFGHFEKVFSKEATYREAFLNFTRLTSSLRCGHTFPSFFNQNAFISQVVLDQPDKIPFTFRVLGEQMIVCESLADSLQIPPGAEIISINGIPAATILRQTANLVKADGSNDAKRYADLSTFGFGKYEAFDSYFPLLYPAKNNRYEFEIKNPGSQHSHMISAKTISRKERQERLKKLNPNYPSSAEKLWKLEFWDNSTAYLQLGTFSVFNFSFEWNKFLSDAFAQIKKRKIEKLVIDIRWNEGGQDEVLLFLGKKLAQKAIKIPNRTDLVRYLKIPDELKPWLSTWDQSFFDLTGKAKPYSAGFYAIENGGISEIPSSSSAFDGQVFILINSANSSATFYFAEIAKENQIATLVGQTTGGSQKGLNAGVMFFLRLPNSGIEIDIPVVGTFSDQKPQGGIVPDVEVIETPGDIANRNDRVIQIVKEIIKKGKKTDK